LSKTITFRETGLSKTVTIRETNRVV